MTFGFELDESNEDLHPEDLLASKFELPVGDQHPEMVLAASAEQDAFDAIADHFGSPSLDNWWENE